MSLDVAIINLDRKQILRPLDLGLRSDIRNVENVATLFHVAVVRLLEGPWAKQRVAVIHEGWPEWDTAHGRENGWTNILPDVVANLVTQRTAIVNEQHGGKVAELMGCLVDYARDLEAELGDLEWDEDDDLVRRAYVRDFERAQIMIARLSGQEPMPIPWADLLWHVPPWAPAITQGHDVESLILSVDDEDPFLLTLGTRADARAVFLVRDHVTVQFHGSEHVGRIEIGLGRADVVGDDVYFAVDEDLYGEVEAVHILTIPVVHDVSVIPCYLRHVSFFDPADPEEDAP